jgi:hypothetical protein
MSKLFFLFFKYLNQLMLCYDCESVRLVLLPDVDYAEDSECNDNDAKYEIFVTINA